MMISTKGRYALRTMLDIALFGNGKPVRIKDIGQRENISVKYLEQIIAALVKCGYVRSVRGSQGGYFLSKEPEEYTAGMILRAVEGNMAPVDCLAHERNQCSRQLGCVTLRLWKELDDSIRTVLDRYTLEDLMQWNKELFSTE